MKHENGNGTEFDFAIKIIKKISSRVKRSKIRYS